MPDKKRILVCDDEEGVRESLSLILSDGYDLSFARDAKEALRLLEGNRDIELLLLDIKMPRMDGLEALGEIKKKNPGIKVVIVTGYQSVEVAGEAVKRGASGYVVKPFDKDNILETVRKTLGQ